MSRLQAIQDVTDLVVFWSRVLAVALMLLAGWVILRAPNARLRRVCCRHHRGLSHSQWLSESLIPLLYVTPLALQVYGEWFPTKIRRHSEGMGALAWWLQLQPRSA